MMLLGIDWFVVEDSSRKAKLVVSLYVVHNRGRDQIRKKGVRNSSACGITGYSV
jgi:hypothetical protein